MPPRGADEPTHAAEPDRLAGQPLREVERDGVHYTLLGTAHVSKASVEAVHALVERGGWDAVGVEVCTPRMQSLRDPDALSKLDLFRVLREGKTGMVAANLALSAYQRRLSEQLGVEPGAEMRAAMEQAEQRGLPAWPIDRDVGLTLRRTYAGLGFWRRAKMLSGLMASVVVDDEVDADEIERLKQGDVLESTFSEFAQRDDRLFGSLIDERDRYMAASLREHAAASGAQSVLAVVGAGHLAGLSRYLEQSADDPRATQESLKTIPPGGWVARHFGTILIGLIALGIAWGFTRDFDVGAGLLLDWVIATASLGAIGCLLAGGHPLSVIAAAISSPFTPIHPLLSSGMVSATVELAVRRPQVSDFGSLRDDVTSVRGWWRNRVSRVLLNFLLTNFGTALGVYLTGWRILDSLL
ncbi:MAG: TraB/GumN family protein [Xanthomonadales bacterium]|nr:TraB/GumN family protein [Xanthomonadales bacterium]